MPEPRPDILTGPLRRGLVRFAMPLALTQLLAQLFTAADLAVVGRFVGKEAMAAVGSCTPLVGITVTLFFGTSIGTNVVIATWIGAGDQERARRAETTSLWFALVGGCFLAVFGELLAPRVLRAMSVPAEVLDMATLYLRIYLGGMPVILLYTFAAAIFRARGDTKTPFYCLTAGGILNVGLNLVFVCVLKRHVDGVAVATVASNAVSSVLLIGILARERKAAFWRELLRRPDFAALRRILAIGLPAGVQGMMFSLSNILIQSSINRLGATVMAASAAAFNLEIFAFHFINSVGQACTTFIGQNHGAGNHRRCRQIFWHCLWLSFATVVLVNGTLLLFARPLLALFNTDPEVIRTGITRMLFVLLAGPVNATMEVTSGALRGFGKSLYAAATAVLGICGLRIVLVLTVFRRFQTFPVLMAIYPFTWFVTDIALCIACFLVYRRLAPEETTPGSCD